MKVTALTPETEVLRELGARLARARKQQGFSQTTLAEEAGLGVATLRRIEGGQDSHLGSWLKLLRALNMSAAVDTLLPEQQRSPMAEVRKASRKRERRAPSPGIVWGDEVE